MEHGHLHSLIPLTDFKAVLGIDDREDALSRYCLITATYTIEQYCKRRFCRKKHTDYLTFTGEHIFTLREYPVQKVLAVHAATAGLVQRGDPCFSPENPVDSKYYYCLPDEGYSGRHTLLVRITASDPAFKRRNGDKGTVCGGVCSR